MAFYLCLLLQLSQKLARYVRGKPSTVCAHKRFSHHIAPAPAYTNPVKHGTVCKGGKPATVCKKHALTEKRWLSEKRWLVGNHKLARLGGGPAPAPAFAIESGRLGEVDKVPYAVA